MRGSVKLLMAMRGSVKLLKFKILRKGFPCLGAFSLSAFPRFMSSATSSSATSDAVQQQTFLPSVSWLIHKHHLTPQIVSSIPTSGKLSPFESASIGLITGFLNTL